MKKTILLYILLGATSVLNAQSWQNRYDSVTRIDTRKFHYYTVFKNGNQGLCDTTGREIVVPKYDTIYRVVGKGFFAVKEKNTYGVIDMTGNEIIRPVYIALDVRYIDYGYIDVKSQEGKWGLSDTAGNIIFKPLYNNTITTWVKDGFFGIMPEDKWGMVKMSGKTILPPIYENINYDHGYISVKKNEKWGICDSFGKEILPPSFQYDKIDLDYFKDGYVKVRKNKKWGLCKENGKVIVSPDYDKIGMLYNNYIEVKKNGKYGILRIDGKKIITPKYDLIFLSTAENGLFVVKKDKYCGVCDTSDKEIIAPIFENISLFYSNDGIIKVEKDKKKGCYDIYGNEIIESAYTDISIVEDYKKKNKYIKVSKGASLLSSSKEKKVGLYDMYGRLIVAPEYNKIDFCYFSDDYLIVTKNGKEGIVDKRGEVIIETIYDKIDLQHINYGFIIVNRTGLLGVCNKSGEEVVAPIYDGISSYYFINGNIGVKKNGKTGLLARDGHVLIPCEYAGISVQDNSFKIKGDDGKWHNYDINRGTVVFSDNELYNKFFDEADILFKNEKWGKSLKKYRMAASYKETFSVNYNIAACFFNRGEYVEAEQYYTRSLNYEHDQRQEKNAREMIDRSRQAQQRKADRRQRVGEAIAGTILGAAGAILSSGTNGGTSSGDPDYQAWMKYRQSGLSGASTISFEDFKKANAKAAANGYQVGGGNNQTATSPSSNTNTSSTRTSCSFCNGTGRIIKDDAISFGLDKKYCEECKKEVFTSHYHAPCPQCNGHGYK